MRPDDLVAELKALLVQAAAGPPPLEAGLNDGTEESPAATALQEYARELRDLCGRVLRDADEPTARAFWLFLIETAARHGRRAGGSSG